MHLIIGGAYQGKLDYAKNTFGIEEADICICTANEEPDFTKRCLVHYEEYIRYCLRTKKTVAPPAGGCGDSRRGYLLRSGADGGGDPCLAGRDRAGIDSSGVSCGDGDESFLWSAFAVERLELVLKKQEIKNKRKEEL